MLPLFDSESDGELENVALGVIVGLAVIIVLMLGLTVEVALVDGELLSDTLGDTLAEREDVIVEVLRWLVETDTVGDTFRLIDPEVDVVHDLLWEDVVDVLWLVDAVPLRDTVVLCVTE